MSSFLILVDAGYVYAEGGLLVHGTKARHELTLNPSKLRDCLVPFAAERAEGRLLRMYWYDAAHERRATPEHHLVADLEGVQLRLGRLTPRGVQKGVDSLIYRDLFTLSQTGRVSDVFLLAGDEDLLEAVHAAQDCGVRAHLVGIEPNVSNQAASLRQAADAVYVLQREQLVEVLHRRPAGERAGAPVVQERKLRQLEERFAPSWSDSVAATIDSVADGEVIRSTSEGVAAEFCQRASTDELASMREQLRDQPEPHRRRLPQRADGWLLRASGDQLGRLLTESERLHARRVLWTSVSTILDDLDRPDGDHQGE